jgi:hypothetical protein
MEFLFFCFFDPFWSADGRNHILTRHEPSFYSFLTAGMGFVAFAVEAGS